MALYEYQKKMERYLLLSKQGLTIFLEGNSKKAHEKNGNFSMRAREY